MTRAGLRIGIDANLPLITEGAARGELAPQVAKPEIIGDTGAGWVRLNFVLGPWSGPNDTTLHQGRTWEGAYRTIVAGLRKRASASTASSVMRPWRQDWMTGFDRPRAVR